MNPVRVRPWLFPKPQTNTGTLRLCLEDTMADPTLSIEGIDCLHTVHTAGEYVLWVFIAVMCLTLFPFA